MPRGDKPTTTALALKDGWIYEDALPATITAEQYDWWFKESLVLDGVRMGPPLTTQSTTTEPTLEELAIEAARFLESMPDIIIGKTQREAQQLAFALRARVTAPIVAPVMDGISWSALLSVLERLKSKTRNPDAEWYHGWNAAIQCLINDINGRRRSVPASTVAPVEQALARLNEDRCMFCGGKTAHEPDCDHGVTAPASPVALRDEAEDFARRVVGTVFDNTAASHETLKQTMIERIADSVTPPSTAAKAIAEELKVRGFLDLDLFVKASGERMEQIAAIIERCLFAEREDQKGTTK